MLAGGGRKIALDGQGPLRAPALGPLHLTGRLGPELLRHVHALKLSEEEAIAAFGTLDAVEIARRDGRRRGARHARGDRRARGGR